MNVILRFLLTIALLLGCIGNPVFSKAQDTPVNKTAGEIKKTIKPSDRYMSLSSAPAAIKVKLKDIETGQTFNAVVTNESFFSFLKKEKGFSEQEYVNYMIKNDDQIIDINLSRFKEALGKEKGTGYFFLSIFSKKSSLSPL